MHCFLIGIIDLLDKNIKVACNYLSTRKNGVNSTEYFSTKLCYKNLLKAITCMDHAGMFSKIQCLIQGSLIYILLGW